MKRRLVAILVADIVSYSSMMEADEEGTAARLAACRALADAEIAKADGRLFKAMGDALLVEFASPTSAVHCAVGIRNALALAEHHLAAPLAMRFGLHLADAMVDGDDLIGDGVNLAARIQQAADPGAIDVSSMLFDQIRRTSSYTFDDRGEQHFRNIAGPVRILRLRGELGRHLYQVAPTQIAGRRATRPYSIAVLPFAVSSQDEEQRFLAEGIAEELVFELGRLRKLFVTSYSATRALEGTSLDPQSAGARLGVRYLLTGSIRQLGQQVRLSLAISETQDGNLVWSDRLSLPFDDLVEGLDEAVSRIAATVLGRVEHNDITASRRLKPESMTAFELHLRGLERHRLGGVTDANLWAAVDWFERAVSADPDFARPQAMWVCARSGLPDFDWDDGERRMQRALELDANDPDANRIMGAIQLYRGAFDAARQYHEKAMSLSPSDAYIKGRSAAFYNFAGDTGRALQLLDEAEELDPFLHVWCIEERVATFYNAGRFVDAIEAAQRLSFQTRRSRVYSVASRMALGQTDLGRQTMAEAIVAAPDLTADFVRQCELYRDDDVTHRLIELLAAAGLPADGGSQPPVEPSPGQDHAARRSA